MQEAKKITIGVTGSIAAYKALDLIRRLKEKSIEVEVAMTKAAGRFVAPLSFAALSGRRVITSSFDKHTDPLHHINLARQSHMLAIVPATANIIGKFSSGIADDFISTFYLAFQGPVLIAPAMNEVMWEHPAVRTNIDLLKKRGVVFVEPGAGSLACGEEGKGRLAEVDKIVEKIVSTLQLPGDFSGKKVLISAGPTREPIDPVRFISNRSSAKMGFALAETAAGRGARVTLVSGPTALDTSSRIRRINVETASQMAGALKKEFPAHDVLVMAAAVADFHVKETSEKKIRREDSLSLDLEKNEDILAGLAEKKEGRVVVGFALENGEAEAGGRRKLVEKNLDLVVINDINTPGAGFDTDTNVVTILDNKNTPQRLPMMSKAEVADKVWDRVASLFV
jgi:phosphopantothenoylcysteine decarboxylase/phosphopantothenate--cysteine ligase